MATLVSTASCLSSYDKHIVTTTAYFQSTQLVHPGRRKRSPRNLQPRITRMKNTLNRFQGGFYKIILPPPTAPLSFRANHKTTWEQSHPEHNLVKLSHIHKKNHVQNVEGAAYLSTDTFCYHTFPCIYIWGPVANDLRIKTFKKHFSHTPL